MAFDDRFSSTVPAPLEGSPGANQAPPTLAPAPRADYEVLGRASTQMASALAHARQALDALVSANTLGKEQARDLIEALDAAARVAMQGRLLARLAGGSVRHNNEQVHLDQTVDQLLDLRQASLARAGTELRRQVRPVTVMVDRDLVTALVDAALEWALEPGHKVEVHLEVKTWPAHGLLRIRSRPMVRASAPAQEPDQEKVGWHLVNELCRTVGVTLDRVRSPGETLLMLEFPRTVREIDGLSATELELGLPSAMGGPSRALAGHRALIVTSDVRLREEAKLICQSMGLEVDNVPSSLLAAQRCGQVMPDIILVDERFNDEQFSALRAQLDHRTPNFPVIEIAYGRVASHPVVGWGSGKTTSVSRSELASQLPQALALEMSKVL